MPELTFIHISENDRKWHKTLLGVYLYGQTMIDFLIELQKIYIGTRKTYLPDKHLSHPTRRR